MDCGLTYFYIPTLDLMAYSDTDWALDINTRRSTTGYVVFLGQNLVSQQSNKQAGVSQSLTEAKYKALANIVADVAWIRLILMDLEVFFFFL